MSVERGQTGRCTSRNRPYYAIGSESGEHCRIQRSGEDVIPFWTERGVFGRIGRDRCSGLRVGDHILRIRPI